MTKGLQPGSYIKTSKVQEFISPFFKEFSLAVDACPQHAGPGVEEFFSTRDIQGILPPSIFKELETRVITYCILAEDC
jgi:hypothetical protein